MGLYIGISVPLRHQRAGAAAQNVRAELDAGGAAGGADRQLPRVQDKQR